MVYGQQPNDTNTPPIPISSVYDTEGNTFPALAGELGTYMDANNNASSAALMSFMRPRIVQSKNAVTGVAGKTLNCIFNNNNKAGNSIIVCVGMGEVESGASITLAITDSQGNTYQQCIKASQSTTLESAIFLASDIKAGANTITATIAGAGSSNTAIAIEMYEMWGIIAPISAALDQTAPANSSGSTSISTAPAYPTASNEFSFMAIAAAGGTITGGINWTLDSGTLSPTGGNLVSFGAESLFNSTISPLTPTASLSSSNAWAAAYAMFKTVIVPIAGQVGVFPLDALSTLNSTTATLTSGSVFTGTSESTLNYSAISIQVFADQASAASGLSIQQSQNGTNWDIADTFTISASTAFNTVVNLIGSFFRVVYTNGGTGQGTFRLQVVKLTLDDVLPRTLTALGNLKVAIQEALPTGSNVVGGVTQSGTWTEVPNAATSGGSTPSHTISAASTNATSLKGSAGQVYGFCISNSNAAARYFKLYNKATAPTVGTDTPVMTVQVPGSSTVIRAFPVGLALGTGIAWALTTGIANSDTGAVGTDISVDIDYL